MTGSFQIDAKFSDSWNAPSLFAPSPKKHMTTDDLRCLRIDSAAPTAIGMPPPTMPFAPRLPRFTSAICIEPPRPRQ